MKKLFMVMASICLLATSTQAVTAATKSKTSASNYDWTSVMEAIIQVESEGNPKAKSGNSVGAMQITPVLVAECNAVLKKLGSKKKYTLRDRYSVEKSKEMFLLMQRAFNPSNNVEQAIRAWNGGNHYSKKRTQRYYEKVMKLLKKQTL